MKADESINVQSTPAAGRTLNGSMKQWVNPLASVFSRLLRAVLVSGRKDELIERYQYTYKPVLPVIDLVEVSADLQLKLAVSALLCQWLTARLANPRSENLSMTEAQEWFMGNTIGYVPGLLSDSMTWIPSDCTAAFRQCPFDSNFKELMPYVLQVFELTDTQTGHLDQAGRRTRQRQTGSIYTPSDVSDFIVRESLDFFAGDDLSVRQFTCLDPACGTGLFLRSAMNALASTYRDTVPLYRLLQGLYGMDMNPQAIQSCAFVLMAQAQSLFSDLPSPWHLWHLIRGNLSASDSTLVTIAEATSEDTNGRLAVRSKLRLAMATGNNLVSVSSARRGDTAELRENTASLSHIFPEVTDGFSMVVGNPPYSRICDDEHQGFRAANFATAPSSRMRRSASLFPLFVEMIWKFGSRKKVSGGMVLPMSIAYSTSPEMKRLRSEIEGISGEWRFCFFDRTPDSLFGDEVKTRNAIVLWHRGSGNTPCRLQTGPLLRWSSRSRTSLFKNITTTDLVDCSIRQLIPKLGSALEQDVYLTLKSRLKLSSLVSLPRVTGVKVGETYPRLVFFGSTAYNWIRVFRTVPTQDTKGGSGFPPSIRAIQCSTVDEADFVFACLNSRLTYWLWRVEGDGFHVTHDFIGRLPLHPSSVSQDDLLTIRNQSLHLWDEMQRHPVHSINAGRTRTSYYPYVAWKDLDVIDSILLRSLSIPIDFNTFLRQFVTSNIIAGRSNELNVNPALRRLRPTEGIL